MKTYVFWTESRLQNNSSSLMKADNIIMTAKKTTAAKKASTATKKTSNPAKKAVKKSPSLMSPPAKNTSPGKVNMKHCAALGELWLFYREDVKENEAWNDFFEWADIGLPLAYMISQDLADPKEDTEKFIEETWEAFCEMIAIDPEGDYDSLTECFEASPNPPLNSEEEIEEDE